MQAAKVQHFHERGQYTEALSASKSVEGLCIAGSVALGFFALLPLGCAAHDSMKEEPTFQVAKKGSSEESEKRNQPIWNRPMWHWPS